MTSSKKAVRIRSLGSPIWRNSDITGSRRGYICSVELGLYYLQSRYYDPELCRFLNADAYISTGQGELGNNMFAYCLNSPINSSDASGYASAAIKRRVCCTHVEGNEFAVGGAAVVVTLVSTAPELVRLANEAIQTLSKIAADVSEYARSLMDYLVSIYENHQPRIHHVIPVHNFIAYGAESEQQMIYMHNLLASVKIDINDPENLLILSQGSHKSMHTKTYINSIYSIMRTAKWGDESSVRWALFLARQYAASLDQYSMGY